MSDDTESGRLDPRLAERLLDGAGGHAELRELLAAASAPGRPGELAGEDAAVAAFLAAPRPARRSRAASLRRFLTAKVIAVVGGSVLLSGGMAYATGNLPGQDPAPAPSTTPREPGGRDQVGGTGPRPADRPGRTPAHGRSGAPGKVAGEPGRTSAPGREKKPASPSAKPTRPRGPGNNNSTVKPEKPEKPKSNGSQGNGSGNGAPQSGNGNPNGNRNGIPNGNAG
ncbi:hypothetical protein GWI34_14335 [Actinomadura sp. DSM 109109]|nr:hypothetical protein [Actinomadura lepetitiana]